MSPSGTSFPSRLPGVLLTVAALLAVAGCVPAAAPPAAPAGPGDLGAEDVVSAVTAVPEIAALLPQAVRDRGVLTVGSAIGTPPIAFHPEKGDTPRGIDIDISDAVGRVLGVRIERVQTSGASLLVGLTSGRFQLGTANLAVTEERKKVLDFTTYVRDGTGFMVTAGNALSSVRRLSDLCGLSVGTGVGTTFEADLRKQAHVCADAGRPAYRISTYSDAAAHFLALREGHVDVLMSTSSVLRYAASQQPGLRYVNDLGYRDIGLASRKGAGLAEALRAAVDRLIADGVYDRVLAKWHLEAGKIDRSVVNPPAH